MASSKGVVLGDLKTGYTLGFIFLVFLPLATSNCRPGDVHDGSYCYTAVYSHNKEMSAQSAQQACDLYRATLPMFPNLTVAAAIATKFQQHFAMHKTKSGDMWLGIRYIQIVGHYHPKPGAKHFYFTNGTLCGPLCHSNVMWATSQPRSSGGKYCVKAKTSAPFTWSMEKCTKREAFVCQYLADPFLSSNSSFNQTVCGITATSSQQVALYSGASPNVCITGSVTSVPTQTMKAVIQNHVSSAADAAVCINYIIKKTEDIMPQVGVNVTFNETLEIVELFDILLSPRYQSYFLSLQNQTDLPLSLFRTMETLVSMAGEEATNASAHTAVQMSNVLIKYVRSAAATFQNFTISSSWTKDRSYAVIDKSDIVGSATSTGDFLVSSIIYRNATGRLETPVTGKNYSMQFASDHVISVTVLLNNWRVPSSVKYLLPKSPNRTASATNLTEYECRYLKFSVTASLQGDWADYGCVSYLENDTHIGCKCNHTTNYGLLMQVNDFEVSVEHVTALQVITYIGCIISLFCLLLSLVIFLFLANLKSDRVTIHKYLSFSLMIFQFVFLLGSVGAKEQILCTVFAVLTQYFGLVSFMWMMMEGVHLLRTLILVYGTENSAMTAYHTASWLVPLAFIGAGMGFNHEGYGAVKGQCWLDIPSHVIWTFVAPVLAICLFNLIVLCMVIRTVIRAHKQIKSISRSSQAKTGIKSFVMLAPLLGITWVFGVLAINENLMVFQYLFAIGNSLQGVFIFLFCICLSSEVRAALTKKKDRHMANRELHKPSSRKPRRSSNSRRKSSLTSSRGFPSWPLSLLKRGSGESRPSSGSVCSSGYESENDGAKTRRRPSHVFKKTEKKPRSSHKNPTTVYVLQKGGKPLESNALPFVSLLLPLDREETKGSIVSTSSQMSRDSCCSIGVPDYALEGQSVPTRLKVTSLAPTGRRSSSVTSRVLSTSSLNPEIDSNVPVPLPKKYRRRVSSPHPRTTSTANLVPKDFDNQDIFW